MRKFLLLACITIALAVSAAPQLRAGWITVNVFPAGPGTNCCMVWQAMYGSACLSWVEVCCVYLPHPLQGDGCYKTGPETDLGEIPAMAGWYAGEIAYAILPNGQEQATAPIYDQVSNLILARLVFSQDGAVTLLTGSQLE